MLTRIECGAKDRDVALNAAWHLRAKAPLAAFEIYAEPDPLLDGMVLEVRAGTTWVRLLRDLSDALAEGGLFRIDLHLRQRAGTTIEWVALLRQDAGGDQRFQNRATPGATADGRIGLTATIDPAEPGVSYQLAIALSDFPASIAVSAVACTRLGDAIDGVAPVPSDRRAAAPAGGEGARLVQAFLWEELYVRAHGLPPDTPPGAVVAHYLDVGVANDGRPNLAFDPVHYRAQVAALGLPALGDDDNAFLHWLAVGRARGIVPTALFDEEEYRALNSVPGEADAYEHYVSTGFRRNFSPSQFFDARWYARRYAVDPALPAIIHYATIGAAAGFAPGPDIVPLAPVASETLPLERFAARLRARAAALRAPDMTALVARAALIEPQIMRPLGPRPITFAPLKHAMAHSARASTRVRTALAGRRFDNVVTIPQCRMAGAARTAGTLAMALIELFPDERTLIVSTERPDAERTNWFPPDAVFLNLPELLGPDKPDEMLRVLLDLVRGLRARRLFNVNSATCWRLLAQHGRQLRETTALYSYLFTWELDPAGTRIGYPVSALPQCLDILDAAPTDNLVLSNELRDRYCLDATVGERLFPVLWSPDEPTATDLHDRFAATPGRPLRCLWAGRFDRQKRMDLMIGLARLRPDLAIDVFGKPVMGDDAGAIGDLPPNVHLRGAYGSIDELDLAAYDFFLYTAAWDGVPTVLIEIAFRGMAVVASAVGGVTDLIDATTGWPVADWESPAAYAATIDAMLASPGEVHARAARLRALAMRRHTGGHYAATIAAMLAHDPRAQRAA